MRTALPTYPDIPEDLLEHLERQFPPKDALPRDTLQELVHYGGKRALIAHLRAVFEQQNSRPADEQ